MKGVILWIINWELNAKNVNYYIIAELFSLLGEKDSALDYLERILQEELYNGIPRINCNPNFKILHNDPRFRAVLAKMNLDDK